MLRLKIFELILHGANFLILNKKKLKNQRPRMAYLSAAWSIYWMDLDQIK